MVVRAQHEGLEGVVAGSSSICLCEAEAESLLYRGISIEDLAAKASFEEVVWLLSRGSLPTKKELVSYKKRLADLRPLSEQLREVIELVPPDASPMAMLRTLYSFVGCTEPVSVEDPHRGLDLLLSITGPALVYWHCIGEGIPFPESSSESSIAGHFLSLLQGSSPTEEQRRALDVTFVLYAEHEFNASTFTARTIASTEADFYSAVTGAVGALSGPLHGGANERALDLLLRYDSVDQAIEGIERLLARKEKIMGFGHRVYRTRDPRTPLFKVWAKALATKQEQKRLMQIAEAIEQKLWEEKKLFPNADFYSATLYYFLRIPQYLFTPLFVQSRLSGWAAHIREQQAHNRLIRPISEYIGPRVRPWVELEER